MTCSWVDPDRSERNAIRAPSGDQTGDESDQSPSVSCRSRVPSMPISQRLDRFWSRMMST